MASKDFLANDYVWYKPEGKLAIVLQALDNNTENRKNYWICIEEDDSCRIAKASELKFITHI